MKSVFPPSPSLEMPTARWHRCLPAIPVLLLLASGLWPTACEPAPVPMATAGPDATQFLGTRIVQILTQNALTNPAPRPSPTMPPPTETSTPPPFTCTPITPCADQACVWAAEHFWFERPIPHGYVNYPDSTYPYGGTLGGQREPHHGVEFANPAGVPVIAAGAGTVVVAGNDDHEIYGPAREFYGNLVVIRHDQTYNDQAVYTLYGHLQNVLVTPGQKVNIGDMVGTVGQTGVALGPHLHFEVRVGDNTYAATRNPELWLKPLMYNGKYWGALAGRVVDPEGRPLYGYPVVIRPVAVDYENPRAKYLLTYAQDAAGLNSDEAFLENFAANDLPLGTYTVAVDTAKLYQQNITISTGRLTWVTFTVIPLPPSPTPGPATPTPAATATVPAKTTATEMEPETR